MTEEEEINLDFGKVKDFFDRIKAKDITIVFLVLIMIIIYMLMTKSIDDCNAYYQNLLINTTRLTTKLW